MPLERATNYFLIIALLFQIAFIAASNYWYFQNRNEYSKTKTVEKLNYIFKYHQDDIIGNALVENLEILENRLDTIRKEHDINIRYVPGQEVVDVEKYNSSAHANGVEVSKDLIFEGESLGRVYLSKQPTNSDENNLALVVLFSIIQLLFIMGIFLLVRRYIFSYYIAPLHIALDAISKNNFSLPSDTRFFSDEIKKIVFKFGELFRNIKSNLIKEEQYNISRQVAHDIRSPLTALNVVSNSITDLDQGTRLLLNSSINRIQDIANNLLQKEKGKIFEKESLELLAPIVGEIVSEKRTEYRGKIGLDIELDLSKGYGLFSVIDVTEFKNIISNIVNNAVEASLDDSGKIKLSLYSDKKFNVISINDTGKGISSEVLEKLRREGGSFGKENLEASGNGIGLSHAKQVLAQWQANLIIESTEGVGTTVKVCLPIKLPNSTFIPELNLANLDAVVVIDDDKSIHQIWKARIQRESNIKMFHFTNQMNFCEWYKEQDELRLMFLVDYEFLGDEKNGLDIIENLCISESSVLVTSRYDQKEIRERCESLKLKVLPKSMADNIPIVTRQL
jgi:signal transduction histidine kinase